MSDPFFVPHITIDGIVTLLSIGTGTIVYIIRDVKRRTRTEGKLDGLNEKVTEHGAKIDKLAAVVETQARHDERILGLERRTDLSEQRWEDLRRGEGFVLPDSPIARAFRAKPAKPE